MNWSISNKINLGFGLALACLIVIGVISYRSTVALIGTVRWEVHTHRVLTELHDVLVQLQSAETGQRGYIITGDERYLEPHQGAADSAAAELASLRRLTADNPRQQRLVDTLEPLISAKFAELESTIRLRESGRTEAAVRVVQSGKGKALMRRIQDVIGAMEREEDALLNRRSREAETGARQAIAVITFGSLVALVFVAIAIFVIHRDLTARRRAEKALEEAFGALEVRVSERTAELASTNQDLQIEIAERKRADRELERSHDDMLSILDRLQVGTAMTDHNGRLAYLSRVAQDLFETGEQALGKPWQHVLTLSEQGSHRLSEMAKRPPATRVKVPAHVETKSRRHYWMEIDVQDDPRDPQRKIFFFYDLSEVYDLRRALDEKAQFYGLVGESPAMRTVYQQIRELAAVDSTVLIEGETGTGKELVAKAIHLLSRRREAPFVAVNCAGLTDSLLSSQLFGHKKGAFTGAVADHRGVFEAANGGTIFLDEIGDVSTHVQTSLLRVLQEREITRLGETTPRRVDLRVIAATHHNLISDVAKERFRADLLYRIRVARVRLPALRERHDDIPLLVAWFLGECRTTLEKPVRDISHDAMKVLSEHDWPGNVRELRSTIEFAAIHCKSAVLQVSDLPVEIAGRMQPSSNEQEETDRFRTAIQRAGGNRTRAARLLGISRATFYRRLAALEIEQRL